MTPLYVHPAGYAGQVLEESFVYMEHASRAEINLVGRCTLTRGLNSFTSELNLSNSRTRS